MIIHLKQNHRLIAIGAAGLLCVTLIAWNHGPGYRAGNKTSYQDTVPAKPPRTSELRDLDKELEKLDRAIERLEEFKAREWDLISGNVREQLSKIDPEEMTRQAELAMKTIDLNKIRLESQKALKAIDVEAMQQQINEAMAEVKIDTRVIEKAMAEVKIELNKELAQIKEFNTEDVNKAMEEVKIELSKELAEIKELDTKDVNKALEEVKIELSKELAEIKELDTEDVNKAMEEVKIELKRAEEELKSDNIDLKKELDKAKSHIEEAKKELRGYQEMIYSMEKEGLLDTRKDYKIIYRDGSIYLNDKKQTDAVTAKYRMYLKDGITIKKEDGRFDIYNRRDKVD
jgi:chromosome segregation ATPase